MPVNKKGQPIAAESLKVIRGCSLSVACQPSLITAFSNAFRMNSPWWFLLLCSSPFFVCSFDGLLYLNQLKKGQTYNFTNQKGLIDRKSMQSLTIYTITKNIPGFEYSSNSLANLK